MIHKKRLFVVLLSVFFLNCIDNKTSAGPQSDKNTISFTILYTNDEHGWMEPSENYGGAAGMMYLWENNEGFADDGNFLVLSGGDMWTGPALSTWFEGESMAAVMNAMHYDAAAVGNHEFDFGQDGLAARASQSSFPFLAANIKMTGSDVSPEYLQSYVIKTVGGVQVGIVGLTTLQTETINFPDNVAGLDFWEYEQALSAIIPIMKSEGVEIIILIGHFCSNEMYPLKEIAQDLGISMIFGGHCNEFLNTELDGIHFFVAGSYMRNYGVVTVTYDTVTNAMTNISGEIKDNIGDGFHPGISSIVSQWKSQLDDALSEVIGYANEEINRHGAGMHNMITDSWLVAWPAADVSVTNTGGMRQHIPVGDISIATMVGVLPFENYIVELDLTGSQIASCLEEYPENLVVGGMTTIGGFAFLDGTPIHADSTYKVLTLDYLYYTSNTFQQFDPDPVETSIHFRQPVIEWIRSLNTSENNPLNLYLDYTARQ